MDLRSTVCSGLLVLVTGQRLRALAFTLFKLPALDCIFFVSSLRPTELTRYAHQQMNVIRISPRFKTNRQFAIYSYQEILSPDTLFGQEFDPLLETQPIKSYIPIKIQFLSMEQYLQTVSR